MPFPPVRWQDELLSFLSLTRMLHWPQVHWLKLFAVMVGSLNNVSAPVPVQVRLFRNR